MMNNKDLNTLLAVTAEECAELTQVCMKILRFGMNDDYKPKRPWLIEEAGDVQCAINLLVENGVITQEELDKRAELKRNKLKVYSPNIIKETQ